jgi:hypothetical protein
VAWIQDFISAGVVAMAVRGHEKPAALLQTGLGIWLLGPERTEACKFRPLERANYLFGENFSAADPYLFMLARGALELELPLARCFRDYVDRIEARPSLREAERRESA